MTDPADHTLWRTLLEPALRAPSPHNVQPWRIRLVNEREAQLWIEKRRTLPKEDVHGSFIVLTMGLFVETLRQIAAHHHLRVAELFAHELDWYAAEHLESLADERFPFATLRLADDGEAAPAFALETIAERRTSRLRYRAEPVADADVARLAALAEAWGHRFAATHDPERIERVLAWNVEAVFADLAHAPYREELAGWLRYSRAASERHRDGLDARCMNQAPLELWLAFHAPALLGVPGARGWFARRYRAQIGPVATLGLLGGPFWAPRDAYATGRFLTHFWLECTKLGYWIHPYGNLVTNRPVAARVEAETGVSDVWLAFKIGRSDPPPVSRRRSLEEVLL